MIEKIALIGIGLIGSSLAYVVRERGLARHIAVMTRRTETLEEARRLDLGDSYSDNVAEAVQDADMVVLCTPIGTYKTLAEAMAPHLKAGAIMTDVGSAKQCVFQHVRPYLKGDVHLIPAHPVAGTEHSGPAAGFSTLFAGRYCIVTPYAEEQDKKMDAGTLAATETVEALWRAANMTVVRMSATRHDQILALTSHLPHLIAYSIVDTTVQLGSDLQEEVFRYAAGGFRDFTRIAASDPVMWRDIFLENREAVLEMLGRFDEDLTTLRRAIRQGDGEMLEQIFTRTRQVRRSILQAGQHEPEDAKTFP